MEPVKPSVCCWRPQGAPACALPAVRWVRFAVYTSGKRVEVILGACAGHGPRLGSRVGFSPPGDAPAAPTLSPAEPTVGWGETPE